MFTNFECPWYVLDNSHKTLLGACLIVFGLSGVLLNSWMITTFIQSHLLSFKSHLLVLNLCTACLARGILGGFPFAGPSALVGRWLFGQSCCQLFAFMHQLLGVFQMAAITVLCFERFFVARKMKYGKELSIKFYLLCISLCWMVSVGFSVPPLLFYGSFGCDVSGTSCSLDWRFTSERQAAFNIPLLLFAGVLPIIIIIVSLWKAMNLSRRLRSSDMEWEQWSLTKSTLGLVCVTLLLWTPQALLSAWVGAGGCCSWPGWLPRPPPPALVLLAPLGAEASTMVPFLCYLASEPRIRTALLGRCKKDYGIIRGGRKSTGLRLISD